MIKDIKKKAFRKKYIIIYGKHSCAYCQMALKLVKQSQKLTLKKFINVRSYDHLQTIKSKIITNKKIPDTIPIILIDNVYVGGYTQLKQKYN